MPVLNPYTGMPGGTTEKIAQHRTVAADGYVQFRPAGVVMDGIKTRDPDNPTDITRLRAGLLIGKITSSGKFTNSIIGATAGALAGSGTSITLSVAQATELARRIGTSGTLTLTGPPAANGVVRQSTITYSNVVPSTGVVTITAPQVNDVQTVNFNIASTGGNVVLRVPKPDGTLITTTTAAWSATDATYLANIQTVLDVASGVANGIVVSAIAATDTDLGFVLTYSGTGYAGLPQPVASVVTLPTSSTTSSVVHTTTGSSGAFAAGSFVGDTDGSQTPESWLGGVGGWEDTLPGDGTSDLPNPRLAISGNIDGSQLLPWPTDTSLRQWIRTSLNALGKFVFTEAY